MICVMDVWVAWMRGCEHSVRQVSEVGSLKKRSKRREMDR